MTIERRRPAHVIYGGAHLFRAETPAKLGALARAALATYAPDAPSFGRAFGVDDATRAATLRAHVAAKLDREPVEDLRIDFEDGFGVRPEAEEDEAAERAAREVARAAAGGLLPAQVGIRVKRLGGVTRARAERTLDLFLRALVAAAGAVPTGFVVTLPKVESADEVAALAARLETLEGELGLAPGAVGIEIMVETPRAILDQAGTVPLLRIARAGGGRCVAAHFGTYDYTAACGVTASHQSMGHPACDFARHVMQVALAGSGVAIADGATTVLPVAIHRGEALSEGHRDDNQRAIHAAWRMHFDNVQESMRRGFDASWDLHPAQLPARWAAVLDFSLRGLDAATARLKVFIERAAQATLTGGVFDDAATGQGLLNEVLRAVHCGAATDASILATTGLTPADLATRSFAHIVERRRGAA